MLADMIAANQTSRPMPDDRLTVGKWLNTWLRRQRARPDLRPNTVEAYERSVRLLLPAIGGVPLRRLRSMQVETALVELRAKYTAHTVAGARSVLSTAVKDAEREGHVLTNQAALARAPKVRRSGLVAPDTATVRAILAELRTHRLWALYVLLAGTALRIGEATGLRWDEDLQLKGKAPTLTVHLQAQRRLREGWKPGVKGAKTEHVLTDPKTDAAGRIVVLPPAIVEALRAHKARQAEERLAAGRNWRDTGLVFTTAEGQPVAQSTAEWVLEQACKRIGVRHVRPHDLRRWALTTVADAVGSEAAQRMAGHTTPAQTEQYISRTKLMLTRAADALQEGIG